MINNPVTFSIDYLADASKDIPNMVVQLSFLVMSGIIVMVFAFAKDLNQARKGVMTTVLIEYMCFSSLVLVLFIEQQVM